VLKSDSAATDLDLISYLKPIPDARMRRGVRIPGLTDGDARHHSVAGDGAAT